MEGRKRVKGRFGMLETRETVERKGKVEARKGGNVVVERTGEREGKGEKREQVVDRVNEGERKGN